MLSIKQNMVRSEEAGSYHRAEAERKHRPGHQGWPAEQVTKERKKSKDCEIWRVQAGNRNSRQEVEVAGRK